MTEIETIKQKIQILKDLNKFVHITLENGKFYNGVITYISADFIFIDERKEGKDWLIFISEIKAIDLYEKKGEE